eukprot:2751807-Rhodomonas_salina.2
MKPACKSTNPPSGPGNGRGPGGGGRSNLDGVGLKDRGGCAVEVGARDVLEDPEPRELRLVGGGPEDEVRVDLQAQWV